MRYQRASSSLSGEVLPIPDVAPGVYQYCVALQGSLVCKDGTLAPGSVLALGSD